MHKQSNGIAFPKASTIAEILKREELGKGDSTVRIPDIEGCVGGGATLEAGLLEAIDTAANRTGVTRSAFIASAARKKAGV